MSAKVQAIRVKREVTNSRPFGRDDIQRWKRRCFAAYVQWGKGDDQRWICQHVHNTAKGAIACGAAFDKAREEES